VVADRRLELADDLVEQVRDAVSIARYRLARVCASMPWAASTSRTAPSQAARLRETS
jgi:hypothetical protein